MVYINPSKLLEVIDSLERQNTEYNNIYEKICQCRSELNQYSSLSKEADELGKISRELLDEIGNQKRQINVLNQITEMYLMSDDRALDRTESGKTAIVSKRPGIAEQNVPSNDIPINVFN